METWRPYTLFYPGLVGLSGAGLASDHVSALRLLGSWLVPTLGWIAGLYGGDYFDRTLDAAAKPHRPIPSGRISPRTALASAITCVLVGCAIGVLAMVPAWWRHRRVARVAQAGKAVPAPAPAHAEAQNSQSPIDYAHPPHDGF